VTQESWWWLQTSRIQNVKLPSGAGLTKSDTEDNRKISRVCHLFKVNRALGEVILVTEWQKQGGIVFSS